MSHFRRLWLLLSLPIQNDQLGFLISGLLRLCRAGDDLPKDNARVPGHRYPNGNRRRRWKDPFLVFTEEENTYFLCPVFSLHFLSFMVHFLILKVGLNIYAGSNAKCMYFQSPRFGCLWSGPTPPKQNSVKTNSVTENWPFKYVL